MIRANGAFASLSPGGGTPKAWRLCSVGLTLKRFTSRPNLHHWGLATLNYSRPGLINSKLQAIMTKSKNVICKFSRYNTPKGNIKYGVLIYEKVLRPHKERKKLSFFFIKGVKIYL